MYKKNLCTKFLVLIVILLPFAHAVVAEGSLADILVPGDTLSGLTVAERELIVTRQGMFDYMDGGAELYFDHGWEVLIAADLADGSGKEFKVEVYRVKTHQNALDLLATQQDLGDTAKVGDKSYYGSGMVAWAQKTYYVRLWAWDEYENVRADAIAAAIELADQLEKQ